MLFSTYCAIQMQFFLWISGQNAERTRIRTQENRKQGQFIAAHPNGKTMHSDIHAQARAIVDDLTNEAKALQPERRREFLDRRIIGRITLLRGEVNHELADEIESIYKATRQ